MDVSTFVLIIYPANVEAWQYMKRVESTTNNHQLKWVALPPNIGSENPIRSIGYLMNSTSMVELIYTEFFGIKYSGFLPPSPNVQAGKEPKLQVFIMTDTPAGWNELILICQLLKVYGATVFWSGQEGAWDYFSQRVSYGILFVSNSIFVFSSHNFIYFLRILLIFAYFLNKINNNYRRRGIASVPRLASVLSKTVNIFEFGRKYDASQSGLRMIHSYGKFSCSRLFPHGGCILLTDEMLLMDPQNSHLVLRWFKKRITDSKASTWKLILRRGDVENWLLKTIASKADTNKEDTATQHA
jgi:hypothetical protein